MRCVIHMNQVEFDLNEWLHGTELFLDGTGSVMETIDGDDAHAQVANACVEPKNVAVDCMLLSPAHVVTKYGGYHL